MFVFRLKQFRVKATIAVLTVVLAVSVGRLGDLPDWEAPSWWWWESGLGIFGFYALVVVVAGVAGKTLAAQFRGIARYDSFTQVQKVKNCDVLVLPLSTIMEGRDPIPVTLPAGIFSVDDIEVLSRQLERTSFETGWSLFVEMFTMGFRPQIVLLDTLPDATNDVATGEVKVSSLKPVFRTLEHFGIHTDSTPYHPEVTYVAITEPHNLSHIFHALLTELTAMSTSNIVIDLNGGTVPMSTACAMLGITNGQVMSYKPRDQERAFYDARIRLVNPFTAMSSS
jgi:hypothetical protein